MTFIDGVDYVTTNEAITRFGEDITADTIRGWVRRNLVKPAGRHRGGEWVFVWADLVEVEYDMRVSTFGRPRKSEDQSATIHLAGPPRVDDAARKPWATCTVRPAMGNQCDAPVPGDSPFSLCDKHQRDVYVHYLRTIEKRISDRPKPEPPPAVVYYIRFGDRIKIGTTGDLRQRLRGIPHDEVLATEPGDAQLERMRHSQFQAHRITGEWFQMHPDLLSHIAMLVEHYGPAEVA